MILDILYIILLQIVILAFAETIHRFGVRQLITRKVSHILSASTASLFPFFVSREAAIFCGIFGGVTLMILVWKKILPSLGTHKQFDIGTILFPIGLLIAAVLFWTDESVMLYQYSVLMLAFPDALAGYFGKKYGIKKYNIFGEKTFFGSFIFFVTSFIITSAFLYPFTPVVLAVSALIAVFVTIVEGLSSSGIDNITIPLSSGLAMILLVSIFV